MLDSCSDTEVLLMSYIAWGVECIKKFNGIFALPFMRRYGRVF